MFEAHEVAGAASKRVVRAFVSTLRVALGLLLLASATGDRLSFFFFEKSMLVFYRSHSAPKGFD